MSRHQKVQETMKHAIVTVAMAMAFAGTASAADEAVSRADFKAQQERIEADYKSAKEQCDGMKGNARDICMAQAKGKHEVVKAQLEARRDPGPRRDAEVREKQAEADYKVAREKCDDLPRGAKDACRRDAKATYEHAKGQAKVAHAAGGAGVNSGKALEERQPARDASTAAQYAAAQERCETLSPQARDNCMNEVRRKYGKL
ncbi:MAG TPA: hypothetical protein VGE20_03545 [Ramlibacter sp.]